MQSNPYQYDNRNNNSYSPQSTRNEYEYYPNQERLIDSETLYSYFEGQNNTSYHSQQQWRRPTVNLDLIDNDPNSHCTKSNVMKPLPTLYPAPTATTFMSHSDIHSYQPSTAYQKASIGSSRPRLTATLWEDENVTYYQIDCRGICVARRQDNDMINGTKLLNVAGISRGKRDGILKNERGRVVVKVGAIHLKGVWIPLSRAKVLATQFHIFEDLYPLLSDHPVSYLYPSCIQQLYRMNSNVYRDRHIKHERLPAYTYDMHYLSKDKEHSAHINEREHIRQTSSSQIAQGSDMTLYP
ncbi:transcription regulator HTH, apses-type DNA-binding domain-containing protein [Choanephora cucurbitarum]|nr:transcription regulator HTH, apses-type DNA-binding domain-containing protein [Choanephora cucurbitarum]